MNVPESIYFYLISESTFTDLVDNDSLGYISVEQNSNYPKVTYNIIDRPRIVDASDEWQRWRFYITCTKDLNGEDGKFKVRAVADVLTSLLNSLYGVLDSNTKLDFVQKLTESEVFLRDDNIYESYVDFRILYH